MAKYVDKFAVVAEINKRIMEAPIDCYGHQRVWAYNDVKNILDTLEVKEVNMPALDSMDGVQLADEHSIETKEVDLEKEIDSQWKDCTPVDEGMGCEFANIAIEQFVNIAKYFFNLGLNAKELWKKQS